MLTGDQAIRNFIRRKPECARIKVHTSEGAKFVKLDGNNARRWSEAALTILSLNPTRIECLDAEGNTLRTAEIEQSDDSATAQPNSRFESNLAVVAKLLVQAHQNGANAQKEAYELSFSKMVAIVELAFKRLEGLERAWVRALNLNAKLNGSEDGEAGGDNILGEMMQAFMQGKAAAAAAAAAKETPDA